MYIILGGQWPTKPTYDPKVPWAQPDAERARKVRLALNLAVDKQAIMQRVLGGLGTVVGSWLAYPTDPWASDALKKPLPYDPARAKALLAEAGYPNGFDVTMNLTAWPGRGYLPDVGEAVATYWEKVGLRVKRRPVDRAVFSADFRARAYSGVALAYAAPAGRARSPGRSCIRAGYTKAALNLFMEHPEARRVHRPPGHAAELPGARADHARRDGAVARTTTSPASPSAPRTPSPGWGQGRRVAADPRPHGLPQLGVRHAEVGRAPMARYLTGRLLQTLLSMLVVISIVFVLTRLSGNPIHLLLDVNATERDQEILTRHLGLDKPMPVQYAIYVPQHRRSAISATRSSPAGRWSSTSGSGCPPPSSSACARCS